MPTIWKLAGTGIALAITALLVVTAMATSAPAVEIRVPAGIDHSGWSELLEAHVDERGLIDYAGIADQTEQWAALDAYLDQYTRSEGQWATGSERYAGLINYYNAITVREVLRLDVKPGASFWSHDPFDDRIHDLGGVKVSLDDVEHEALRPEAGYRIHAAIVCAAQSCPPLWREAFTADNLEGALDERFAAWLAREDLNRFDATTKIASLSKIFDWFGKDFREAGGLAQVLARHAPEQHREWLAAGDVDIRYLDYDKTLNAP